MWYVENGQNRRSKQFLASYLGREDVQYNLRRAAAKDASGYLIVFFSQLINYDGKPL